MLFGIQVQTFISLQKPTCFRWPKKDPSYCPWHSRWNKSWGRKNREDDCWRDHGDSQVRENGMKKEENQQCSLKGSKEVFLQTKYIMIQLHCISRHLQLPIQNIWGCFHFISRHLVISSPLAAVNYFQSCILFSFPRGTLPRIKFPSLIAFLCNYPTFI